MKDTIALIMNATEIENHSGISRNFVRLALDSHKLSKHIVQPRPMAVEINEEFIKDFEEFLTTKRSFKNLEKLQKLKELL